MCCRKTSTFCPITANIFCKYHDNVEQTYCACFHFSNIEHITRYVKKMLFFSYPFTSLCNDTLILSHFLVVGNYEFTIAVLLSASQSTSYPIFSERKRSGTIVLPFTSLAGTSILASSKYIIAMIVMNGQRLIMRTTIILICTR